MLFPNFQKDNQAERTEIAHVYRFVLHGPPPEEWDGNHGSIRKVCDMFGWKANNHNKHRKIRSIFLECEELLCKGLSFNQNKSKKLRTGRPPVILPGSVEEGIIADWMEANMGARMTTKMVNEHRRSQGLDTVSKNVILRHVKRMTPKVTTIKKKESGK